MCDVQGKRLGDRGEKAAEAFLRRKGYSIISRSYRCPLGEIDLVARDGETIVFVEVKGRRTARFGSGLEAVTRAKQRRIARVAAHYLVRFGLSTAKTRFDVVGIRWGTDGSPECIAVRDAFRLPL